MKAFTYRIAVNGIFVAALLAVAGANAQFGDVLKQGESGGSGSGMGSLGAAGSALSGKSVTSGSTGNVAGLLEFCVENNYLSGGSASSVKDKLTGKLPGGSPSSDKGYSDGAKGLLHSSSGQQLDLSGGGMQAGVTKQVCEQVLSQAKSLL